LLIYFTATKDDALRMKINLLLVLSL